MHKSVKDRTFHLTLFPESEHALSLGPIPFSSKLCKSCKSFRYSQEGTFGPLDLESMKRRKFYKNTLTHCYQRSADNGVLFYTYSDHLVYFTLYCTLARKHHIRVLAMCQMPDHVHDSILTDRKENMERFKCETNASFSRKHNERFRRKGPVFEGPYGRAPKMEDKRIRTNLIYVENNPVERKLVIHAEEYRWNYLAYAVSDHPFSERLIVRKAAWPLRKAVREVKAQFKAGKPMNYAQLERLFLPLNRKEKLQLTDFIITTYNVIDYQAAVAYFGSYEKMLTATHSTTGSEYDLKENFIGKSDACYNQMTALLLKEGMVKDIHDLLSMSDDEKYELFLLLQHSIEALPEQIAGFLHLAIRRK